jgi:hypothetical protein
MSRGAGAPRSGDASASREPGPHAAGMRPSASRSRPPDWILFVMATLLPFVTRLRKGLPVATGECRRTPAGWRHEFISGLTEAEA